MLIHYCTWLAGWIHRTPTRHDSTKNFIDYASASKKQWAALKRATPQPEIQSWRNKNVFFVSSGFVTGVVAWGSQMTRYWCRYNHFYICNTFIYIYIYIFWWHLICSPRHPLIVMFTFVCRQAGQPLKTDGVIFLAALWGKHRQKMAVDGGLRIALKDNSLVISSIF